VIVGGGVVSSGKLLQQETSRGQERRGSVWRGGKVLHLDASSGAWGVNTPRRNELKGKRMGGLGRIEGRPTGGRQLSIENSGLDG